MSYAGTIKHTAGKHTFVGCRIHRTTAQTIATATNTNVLWDGETVDTHGFHSTSSNTDRIVIPTGFAGYYEFGFNQGWASNATGMRQGILSVDGSTGISAYLVSATAGGNSTRYSASSPPVFLNAAQYVVLIIQQTSGGNLDTESGAQLMQMYCKYLGV